MRFVHELRSHLQYKIILPFLLLTLLVALAGSAVLVPADHRIGPGAAQQSARPGRTGDQRRAGEPGARQSGLPA